MDSLSRETLMLKTDYGVYLYLSRQNQRTLLVDLLMKPSTTDMAKVDVMCLNLIYVLQELNYLKLYVCSRLMDWILVFFKSYTLQSALVTISNDQKHLVTQQQQQQQQQ